MNEELKPCPFCGGETKRVRGIYGLNFFKCQNKGCHAVVSFDDDYFNARPDEAVVQWNSRAAAKECCFVKHDSYWRCTECRDIFLTESDAKPKWQYCPTCGAKIAK